MYEVKQKSLKGPKVDLAKFWSGKREEEDEEKKLPLGSHRKYKGRVVYKINILLISK